MITRHERYPRYTIWCDSCSEMIGGFWGKENEEEMIDHYDAGYYENEVLCWKCLKIEGVK